VIFILFYNILSTFSVADMLARKQKYTINPTQELLAIGLSNVFSSFFLCFVGGASMARSSVQENAGGKTQVIIQF
jgi:MFS superfamily sulfate permease-like transporter